MGALQPWHAIVVLIVALIIFGPGKLSGIGHELGASIRDFRKSMRDDVQPSIDALKGEPAKSESGEVKS